MKPQMHKTSLKIIKVHNYADYAICNCNIMQIMQVQT